MQSELTQHEVRSFFKDGFVIKKNFLSNTEIEKLYNLALEDENVSSNAIDLNDQTGKKTKLTLWFTPGDDLYSKLICSERMVNNVAKLLDSPAAVCHFHTKLMQKQPKVGGAWEWHQDYGYWYKNQFLFPDQLISVMVALNKANKENGCLQVIKGSHKLGRLNHGFAGEQIGADMEMVNNALKTMELLYVELEPGDALFFHSNILHRSEANLSDKSRWSIISCYNSLSNPAYNDNSTSWQEPIRIISDEDLLESEAKGLDKLANRFLNKSEDPALKTTVWEKDIVTSK